MQKERQAVKVRGLGIRTYRDAIPRRMSTRRFFEWLNRRATITTRRAQLSLPADKRGRLQV